MSNALFHTLFVWSEVAGPPSWPNAQPCTLHICASCSFQVYNYYEPIKFVFLRGAFGDKFIAATSENITSTNPQQPTQVKLAFTEDPRWAGMTAG